MGSFKDFLNELVGCYYRRRDEMIEVEEIPDVCRVKMNELVERANSLDL